MTCYLSILGRIIVYLLFTLALFVTGLQSQEAQANQCARATANGEALLPAEVESLLPYMTEQEKEAVDVVFATLKLYESLPESFFSYLAKKFSEPLASPSNFNEEKALALQGEIDKELSAAGFDFKFSDLILSGKEITDPVILEILSKERGASASLIIGEGDDAQIFDEVIGRYFDELEKLELLGSDSITIDSTPTETKPGIVLNDEYRVYFILEALFNYGHLTSPEQSLLAYILKTNSPMPPSPRAIGSNPSERLKASTNFVKKYANDRALLARLVKLPSVVLLSPEYEFRSVEEIESMITTAQIKRQFPIAIASHIVTGFERTTAKLTGAIHISSENIESFAEKQIEGLNELAEGYQQELMEVIVGVLNRAFIDAQEPRLTFNQLRNGFARDMKKIISDLLRPVVKRKSEEQKGQSSSTGVTEKYVFQIKDNFSPGSSSTSGRGSKKRKSKQNQRVKAEVDHRAVFLGSYETLPQSFDSIEEGKVYAVKPMRPGPFQDQILVSFSKKSLKGLAQLSGKDQKIILRAIGKGYARSNGDGSGSMQEGIKKMLEGERRWEVTAFMDHRLMARQSFDEFGVFRFDFYELTDHKGMK